MTITVAVIVVTGVLGNILGEFVCKIFRITEPISKGLAPVSYTHLDVYKRQTGMRKTIS